MPRLPRAALIPLTLLVAACAGDPAPVTPPPVAPPLTPTPLSVGETIDWHDWEPEAFMLAETEDKPILLDLTAVWCHWCHVMDETTYSDPDVIALVNALTIPIRVDTDLRPDVEARYLGGGWPTTAFLTPQGDVITSATYVEPGDMLALLQEVSDYYAENKDALALQSLLDEQDRAADQLEPVEGIPADTVQVSLDWLASQYDPVNGGFGDQPKNRLPGAVELMYRYDYTADDGEWQERANHTLAGMQNLVDPVWGGVYRYSVSADWGTPHYEKLLSDNAESLREFLEAYQSTGDADYRDTAAGIMDYVATYLMDPAGGFYGSQDADLLQPGGHQILLVGEEYFQLSADDREALGIPAVDTTFYADANGQMIVAALEAASVLDEPRYQEVALLALDRLWEEGRGPDGTLWHSLRPDASGDLEGFPPATLDDQANVGLALLAAHSATGQRDYLLRAEELADVILAEYHDPESDAFLDLPASADQPGAVTVQAILTLCNGNATAARLFTGLYRRTTEDAYLDAAEGALRLCGGVTASFPDYALAADDVLTYPLTLAVVGTPGEEPATGLLTAANQLYVPGKVVVPIDPSLGPPTLGELTYPEDITAIYACIYRRCSLPVTDPADLPDTVTQLMAE